LQWSSLINRFSGNEEFIPVNLNNVQIVIFWVVTPCSPVYGVTICCLHLQR
jgi:hypothetical protein